MTEEQRVKLRNSLMPVLYTGIGRIVDTIESLVVEHVKKIHYELVSANFTIENLEAENQALRESLTGSEGVVRFMEAQLNEAFPSRTGGGI